ncbi:hypothetical protein HAX54_036941 [Datura stramonium]|uniref:Uncharacterized protein n=1 Tax=Datura stramonium TaxID=4076 RepID=A0ABS8VIU3_DATST|nr:hypothetical protein [Datura stramonium]
MTAGWWRLWRMVGRDFAGDEGEMGQRGATMLGRDERRRMMLGLRPRIQHRRTVGANAELIQNPLATRYERRVDHGSALANRR